jgi:phosphate transport system ATP-binding protein
MIPPEAQTEEKMAAEQPTEYERTSQVATAPDAVTEHTAHGVSIKGLRAYYGQREVIKGMDIEIRPNEVTAIIGPSGSGKSTVVRCINRMHEEIPGARAEGQVELAGQNVYGSGIDITAVRRLIGMVFQKA